ncbi:hypothetical protein A0H81_02913 [Grifola frondosa]|uniref:F-box domain-containing protein n=1 Tax=Grifola frondosa TaxID=5627 RepID=A0A1C7MHE6_GRIFR|nr:hypothetical protein A0H81_02913 [Grifola frondosa]
MFAINGGLSHCLRRRFGAVFNDRSSLTSAAMERSKGMSLNLVITREPRPYHVIHSLVNSYESPIHELHWICDEDHDPHGTISHLHLNFRAPQMEFLTLRDRSTSNFESFGPVLFQGHTPQLQYLSLSYSQWFPSNEFPSLTHLSLSKIRGSDPNIILRATLSLLSRTPNLRDLVLGDIVYHDFNETRIIPLMFLTRITFESMKHESISVLLRYLDISPDIAMQVFTSHATNPSDLASLSNHFCGRLTTLQFASVDSKTQSKASVSTGMRNMINDCSFVVSAAGSSSALRYNVRGGMVDGLMVWYDRLFNDLPKHDIRELWIRTPWIGGPGWVLPGGASRMKSWSGLETLVVFDCSLHTLLVFLSSVRGICVNLSTLRLIWTSSCTSLDLSVGQNILTEFELRGRGCRAVALVVEAHVGECDAVRHAPEEVEAVFEAIEYRFFEEVPTMAFPDVCNTGWSLKFPAW